MIIRVLTESEWDTESVEIFKGKTVYVIAKILRKNNKALKALGVRSRILFVGKARP